MSSSCCVSGFWLEGLSESGGTRRPSIASKTSFQSRVMTMTIDASVSVCFMMAKFSSKYVKRGFRAFSISSGVMLGMIDCRLFHRLVTAATEIPPLESNNFRAS